MLAKIARQYNDMCGSSSVRRLQGIPMTANLGDWGSRVRISPLRPIESNALIAHRQLAAIGLRILECAGARLSDIGAEIDVAAIASADAPRVYPHPAASLRLLADLAGDSPAGSLEPTDGLAARSLGAFPRCIQLAPGRVGRRASEIAAWIADTSTTIGRRVTHSPVHRSSVEAICQ